MNIKCYGWEWNDNGKIIAKFTTEFQPILKIRNTVLCPKIEKCRVCLFNLDDVNVNCPGVKPDGYPRFIFTLRGAKRVEGENNL